MARIERKYLAHFINTVQAAEPAVYERLGKDLEEFSPELSAQVESRKNILGERTVVISDYEKVGNVAPFYADTDSALFARLQSILDGGLVLDALKTDVVEVKLWEAQENGAYPAVKEEAYIEVTGYGGDNTGYQIPFTLHFTGKKAAGTFNISTKTFTQA